MILGKFLTHIFFLGLTKTTYPECPVAVGDGVLVVPQLDVRLGAVCPQCRVVLYFR